MNCMSCFSPGMLIFGHIAKNNLSQELKRIEL